MKEKKEMKKRRGNVREQEISAKNLNANSSQVEIDSAAVKLPFWYKIFPPCILTLLTVLFYWKSLSYPFQFDDLANISKHFAIRFDNPLNRWWFHTRWMADWLNRFNYQIGLFNPFPYRVVNLIIHIITGLLVFFLILELCNFLEKKNFLYKNSLLIAFVTAALFLLHPVQTQTVSYVIQARMEGLATMFIVATIFAYVTFFSVKDIFLRVFWLHMTAVFGILSCGTKEIMVVTPLLILLVDWFFISQAQWVNFKKRFLFYAIFGAFSLILIYHYVGFDIIWRTLSLKATTTNNRGNILTDNAFDIITPLHFLISEFKVMVHYLLMFLWPSIICVEYDWKLSNSFFSSDSFFPFLILMAVLSVVIYTLAKKKTTFIAFGLCWFFICIAPRTTIFPSAELLCDYKTYLASIGWLFVLAVILVSVVQFAVKKIVRSADFIGHLNYQLIALLILFIPVGFGAFFRNTVWSSPSAFWRDIVNKAPLKARGHNNLGVALSEEGKVDEAIKHYLEAIRLDRVYADPWSNLAVAYSMKNEFDKAITALHGAIAIFPDYPEAYNNLGTLLIKQKKYDDAEKVLDRAIQLRGYYGKAYYNKGRLYLEKGDEEKAWTYFKKATQGDLDTPEGFFTLGQMSLKLKKYEEAVAAFEEIEKRGGLPANLIPQVQFSQANAYYMLKQYDRAQAIYQHLADEYPLDARYLFNLAEALFAKNEFNQALVLFKKVTTLPEPLGHAHFRIANCLEQLKKIDEAKSYLNEILKQSQAPEQFKKFAREELARMDKDQTRLVNAELNQKIREGKGSIKMSELQKILAKGEPKKAQA
jgi:protein O-mannosyl-transferase